MNKVKKSVTLDTDLVDKLDNFSIAHNLKFSQSLNIALAAFVTKYGDNQESLKIILKRIIDKI